jgi:hypothetical protein
VSKLAAFYIAEVRRCILDLQLRVNDALTGACGAHEMADDAVIDATKALICLETEIFGGYASMDDRAADEMGLPRAGRPVQ